MYIVKVTTEEGISRYGYVYVKLTTASLTAPTITLRGTSGENGWYKSEVEVTITNPNTTGTVYYMLTGVENITETEYSSVTIRTSGLTKVVAWVEDSGYISDYSYSNVKIDNVEPDTPTIEVTGEKGNNDWYISDVVLKITSTDENSGIYGYKYEITNKTKSETNSDTVEGQSKEITLSTDGIYSITVYAIDRAGNTSSAETMTIKKDSTEPNSFVPSVTNDSTTSFTIAAYTTDETSGIATESSNISGYKYYVEETAISEITTERTYTYDKAKARYIIWGICRSI